MAPIIIMRALQAPIWPRWCFINISPGAPAQSRPIGLGASAPTTRSSSCMRHRAGDEAASTGPASGINGLQPAPRAVGQSRLVPLAGLEPARCRQQQILIPNLLLLPNWSILVIDPKGGLAAQTAPYREAKHPRSVKVIDPFGVLEKDYPKLVERYPFLRSAE